MILRIGEWYIGDHRRGSWQIQSLQPSVIAGRQPRASTPTYRNRHWVSRILWHPHVPTRWQMIGHKSSHTHACAFRYVTHEYRCCLVCCRDDHHPSTYCVLQTKVGLKKGINPSSYIIRVNPFGQDTDATSTTFYKSFISDGQIWNSYCGAAMHWFIPIHKTIHVN